MFLLAFCFCLLCFRIIPVTPIRAPKPAIFSISTYTVLPAYNEKWIKVDKSCWRIFYQV